MLFNRKLDSSYSVKSIFINLVLILLKRINGEAIDIFKIKIIRWKYRPKRIKILFVGESPPPYGRKTFFYQGRAGLFIHTISAFKNVFGNKLNKFSNFLKYFESKGCYLDDLCPKPSNFYEINKKKGIYIKLLSRRIRRMKPESIIIFGKGINDFVYEAIAQSGILKKNSGNLIFENIPFAGQGHQNDYIIMVEKALETLVKRGILDYDD